jgi:hypothetical protein
LSIAVAAIVVEPILRWIGEFVLHGRMERFAVAYGFQTLIQCALIGLIAVIGLRLLRQEMNKRGQP